MNRENSFICSFLSFFISIGIRCGLRMVNEMESNEFIRVYCRVRPANEKERQRTAYY